MGERQQFDHHLAGALFALAFQQRLEGTGKCRAWKQLLAVNQVKKRHRFPAQRVDDVMVVNDMGALAAGLGRLAPAQRQDRRAAEEAFQPVIEEAHAQAVTDQAGRHGVEYLPQDEAAARHHPDGCFLVIGCAPLRQRLQCRPFRLYPLAVMGVPAAGDLVDEAPVGGETGEVARAAQKQCVRDRLLEMTV